MHCSAYLYVLFTVLAKLYASAQEFALGINADAKEAEKKLPLGPSTFLQLISKGVFVDKTLLIKEMLKIPSWYSVIIAPRKWGKSVNLDMLKTFVRMQVHPNGSRILPVSSTWNYKLFIEGRYHSEDLNVTLERPLLISNIKYKRVIDVHLGQHPTVHLSFANLTFIRNKRKIKSILGDIIFQAFDEHRYMISLYDEVIRDDDVEEGERERASLKRKQFVAYLNYQTSKTKDLERSIQFLIEELYVKFANTKVFLFVDDYDEIFNRDDPDVEIPLFIKRILVNYEQYIEKAFFTGVQPKLYSYSNNKVTIDQFLYTPYPFYGFVKEEMELLYRYYRIPIQHRDTMKYWYGGYEASKESIKEKIHNPWSTCNYIHSGHLKLYWSDANVRDFHLNDILELSEFRFLFGYLLTGKSYRTKSPFISDRKWFHFDTIANKKQALGYLKYAGYLTYQIIHTPGSTQTYSFTIPNYDVTRGLQSTYSKTLRKHFNDRIFALITKTSSAWEQFLSDHDSNSSHLEKHVQKCFNVLLTHSKNDPDDVTEQLQLLANMMIVSTVLSKSLYFINWQFARLPENPLNETTMEPEFVLSSEDRGFIVDIREADDERFLANRTSRYVEMFERYPALHGWKDIKVIFVHLMPEKDIRIFSILHSVGADVG